MKLMIIYDVSMNVLKIGANYLLNETKCQINT